MTTAIVTRPSLIKVIAVAGLVAGTLDIADALIFYGLRVLRLYEFSRGSPTG